MFILCVDNACNACFVKNKRSNIRLLCNQCKYKKCNDKQYGEQKQDNKKNRLAAKSSVPFSALGDNECLEQCSNLKFERKLMNRDLRRAAAKLAKREEKYIIAEDMLKQMKQAMRDLTTKKESQEGLKVAIFNSMKELQANGKYTKTIQSLKRAATHS